MERSLWIDGGLLREDPVAGADTVIDGGWLLPGLVDVHTHPGAENPGDPFDEAVLRQDLADHLGAGVLLIRAPGAAARIPAWAHDAAGLPRVALGRPVAGHARTVLRGLGTARHRGGTGSTPP